MFIWLRTKLRSWLGIEEGECNERGRLSTIEAVLGIPTGATRHDTNQSLVLCALNTAIVEQGKSFQKQLQHYADGICSTELEGLRDRMEKLTPQHLREGKDFFVGFADPAALTGKMSDLHTVTVRKKKPRAKAKKGR